MSSTPKPVDWARISQEQIAEADPGLADRLAIWVETNEAQGRVVTTRADHASQHVVLRSMGGAT